MGVRKIREFNIALLEKWCWRMYIDRESLWYRVLVARYREMGGWLNEGECQNSSRWKDLLGVRRGICSRVPNCFGDNLRKSIENGGDTFFWTDPWLSGILFSDRFDRLFELTDNPLMSVADMFGFGWGEGQGLGSDDGSCLPGERMLWECYVLLLDVVLQVDVVDTWEWYLDPSKGYTVRGVYHLLTTVDQFVHLEVTLFVWRLLRNWIPTKDNLFKRGILQQNSQLYVIVCGVVESVVVLFFSSS